MEWVQENPDCQEISLIKLRALLFPYISQFCFDRCTLKQAEDNGGITAKHMQSKSLVFVFYFSSLGWWG